MRRSFFVRSSYSFLASILFLGAACSTGPDGTSSETPGGTAASGQALRGRLIESIGRDNAQNTVTEHHLEVDGKWIRLLSDDPIVGAPHSHVKVRGTLSDDGQTLRVSSIEPDITPGRLAQPLSSAADPGSIAVFLIRDPSAAAQPYTTQQIRETIFEGSNSTNAYFNEVSYGEYGLSGDVFGWYTTAMTDCSNTRGWLSAAMQQAAQQNGFVTDDYRMAVGIYVRPQGNCFYANADIIGDPSATGVIQSFVVNPNVFAHEVGHIIGLSHASGLRCQDPDLNWVPFSSNCIWSEYNDPFDGMGFDGFYYHFNSNSKRLQGWLPEENVVQVESAGEFTIVPQEEAASGTQSLVIPVQNGGGIYHVEMRKQFGFDDESRFEGAVLVRRIYSPSSASDLFDMTPNGDMADASLTVGQTFLDPFTGVSIELVERTASSARVHVGFGGPTCFDGVKNGTETDVDCGGLCFACTDGQSCTRTRECYSRACIDGECVSSEGHGLTAQYYNGLNFDTLVGSYVESVIDFDWRQYSPGTNSDQFSARWSGQIIALETGEHTFRTLVDDGVRLWVDGQLIIDRWQDGVFTADGTIQLTAGQPYDIRMEYFENTGDAMARLLWAPPGQGFDLVPATQLVPAGCTLANATDLGTRGTGTNFWSDACLKITQYPSWWSSTAGLVTLQSGAGTFPVSGTWTDTCTNASGQFTFTSQWQSIAIGNHTAGCPVLLSLSGSGSQINLRWF